MTLETLNDPLCHAKAQLSDMVVNEVSLVDMAANLRKLVVTKRNDMATTTAQKMTLKLPSAAKESLMDGIGQALDKLTAVASLVGNADADDSVTVPEDLAAALQQIGDMLEGLAQQFGGATPPPDEDTPPAGVEGNPPPTSATTGTDGGGAGAAGDTGKSAAAKALPPELHDGDSLKTELHDGDSLKTIMHKAVGLAHIETAKFERLDKAGRKIAGHRYKTLQSLHGELGKLINDLAYDEASADDDAKKKNAAAAPAGEPASTTKSVAPAQPVESAEVRDLRAQLASQASQISSLESTIAKIAKATPTSNGGSVDAPPREENKVTWAPDMSADIAKRKAANGAR